MSNLQDILDQLEEQKEKRTDNTVQLTNEKYQAIIRRNWKGDPKTWLLTGFEKKK